jgi:uncharacterized protein GlcG (DUF336 family)
MITDMKLTFAIALTALPACQRASAQVSQERPLPPTVAAARKPSTDTTPAPQSVAGRCAGLPTSAQLQELLRAAPGLGGDAGGLTGGKFEWGAVVNREGELCAVAVATDDASAAWPGSQAIAKAKAYTANAFSTDSAPLSTARLYTLSQPGHSLWGIAAGNPLNPECLSTPSEPRGLGKVCGGTIAFGGGVPLYHDQKRIGGLGVSGDTACADHEIAKRVRSTARLDPPSGPGADDVIYAQVDPPSVYAHPLCPNTWRNGKKLGDEH